MKSALKIISLFIGSYLLGVAPLSHADSTWETAAPKATQNIDHSAWDTLLKQHITTDTLGLNLFDYAGVGEAQSAELAQYIMALEDTQVARLTKAQQMAFWINLYNAVTVKTILEHYPLESIKDISFSLISFGPWGKELVEVGGEALSLNDIEHEILRPIFKDNRIHYAVNCASIGCPNLQKDAFTADNTESLLEQAAQQFINHPRGVTVAEDELILSSIYAWYEEDFGEDEEEVIEHLKQYANPDLKQQLVEIDEIEDYQYDWKLNQS